MGWMDSIFTQQPQVDPYEAAQTEYKKAKGYGPRDFGGFIEPALGRALDFQLTEGGMPQEEYDKGVQNIGQSLNSSLARANVEGAARGSYNKGNIAGATRPAFAGYAGAVSDLQARRAKMRQDAMAEALRAGIQLAPIAADQSRAEQEGFGALVRKHEGAQAGGWGWGRSS
jgi:hypothetical protein